MEVRPGLQEKNKVALQQTEIIMVTWMCDIKIKDEIHHM